MSLNAQRVARLIGWKRIWQRAGSQSTLLCMQCCCKRDLLPCSLFAMSTYKTSALLPMPSAVFQTRWMPSGKPLSQFPTVVLIARLEAPS